MALQPHIINKIERVRREETQRIQPAVPLGPLPPHPIPIEHPGWNDGDEDTQSSSVIEIDLG